MLAWPHQLKTTPIPYILLSSMFIKNEKSAHGRLFENDRLVFCVKNSGNSSVARSVPHFQHFSLEKELICELCILLPRHLVAEFWNQVLSSRG